MPVKIFSCFTLILRSLLFALYISVCFISFKTTFKINTNLKLTLHNDIFTTSIGNTIYYLKHILLLSDDTELNPSPKKTSFIKFCHWNLNGLAAHDFIKVPLVEVYIRNHNSDMCLSETFLDSTAPITNGNIAINGYSLLRVDYPKNIKRASVCTYFRESLPRIFSYIIVKLYSQIVLATFC